MVAEEIALENKEKQLSTLKQNQTDNRSVQVDKTESDERSHTAPTRTREQVAKMAGVGTGTVARYDAIMKNDEAKQLGTSKRNLQRALTIERNLTESMKQLLDDGVISKTVQQRK